MKRRIFFMMLFVMAISTFGQQRTGKEIEKLFKNISDTEAIMNGTSFQPGNIYKTIILSESTLELNEIEKKLLNDYKQVVLMCNIASKPLYCYFVKDNEDKRGVIGLDGEIIVPPLSGNICNIPNGKNFGILLVGEISKNSVHEMLLEWGNIVTNRDFGIYGLFSAIIVEADKPSIKSLFPIDEYVFLSLGSKGNTKFDIFTAKIVNDDLLWGIVDFKGKQILPNEYTGFIRKGRILDNTGLWGKWVGTTEMDMTEALNYSRDLRADTKRRRVELANSLNSFGEAMMNTAQTIETVQGMTGSSSSDGAGDSNISGDLPTQYKKWASLAERHYNSLTNIGTRGKKDDKDVGGTTGQGMSPSNYTQMKKSLREAQDEMKRIRRKAQKQGISITKSEYEDIQVKY